MGWPVGPTLKERGTNVRKILVADDDKTCRDSIQKVLEREGYSVQTADMVDAALELLAVEDFDLVVCDYRMPGKTGMDLLVELKRRHASVPVLMISAYADALVEAAILQMGALELLKKPIRRQELISRAAKAWGDRPLPTQGGRREAQARQGEAPSNAVYRNGLDARSASPAGRSPEESPDAKRVVGG
jgi:DNA-binding NtrC family response regulator